MRKIKLWMFAAILTCGTAMGLISCSQNDNPTSASDSRAPEMIDPDEFNPSGIDINVALLGTFSSLHEEMAAEYWFKTVERQVTDKTQVVITDQITEGNKADIAKVLARYGTLLLVDPDEENVKKYAEELGVDPNADYSRLEMIGLSGFGDQFVSFYEKEEDAAYDETDPVAINTGNIWDVAPMEYLRLKAFAEWAVDVDKKYTEWQKYLEELAKADAVPEDEDEDEEAAGARGFTRAEAKVGPTSADDVPKLDIAKMPGVDRKVQLTDSPKWDSYKNVGHDNDEEYCPLSITCNYNFKPIYRFQELENTGADYYIVKTTVNWDLTKTLLGESDGYKEHIHTGSPVDRDSYLFFPHRCEFYSEPVVTNNAYSVQVITTDQGGDVWPDNEKHETDITNTRSFDINGNVSGGADAGISADGPYAGGNLEASLGVGAGWSTTESYKVKEWDVAKKQEGNVAGHIITVPEEYRPSIGSPKYSVKTNFKKTIGVPESWVWKASGTKANTHDAAFKVKFYAKPTVCWYSYFYKSHGLDKKEHSKEMSKTIDIPAPNRQDVGFLKIKATNRKDGKDDGKGLRIFSFKAIDKNNSKFVIEKSKYTKFGEYLVVALPARTYKLELKMGTVEGKAKWYKDVEYKINGGFQTDEIESDAYFEEP